MKKILITLFLFTSPLFTQESLSNSSLVAPYFAVSTTWGYITTIGGGAPKHFTPTTWLILEGKVLVSHPQIYLYLQFRTSFSLANKSFPSSEILPIINMENIKIGMLLGTGGIIKDWRSNKRGWFSEVNGGLIFEGGVYNYNHNFNILNVTRITDRFINLGFEINIRFSFQLNHYQGISLGANIGYLVGLGSGDPFYLGLQQKVVSFHMMTYGLSFGLNF